MPRKVTDEDGNLIEVPTEEELTELTNSKTQLAEATKKLEEYGADGDKVNWREARNAIKTLKTALKGKGIEVDDDGKIVEKPASLSQDDIDKRIQDGVNKVLIGDRIRTSLSKVTDEGKRTAILKTYEKLTNGEEITLENVDKHLSDAVNIINPGTTINPINKAINGSFSRDVLSGEKAEKFTETEEGKAFASELGIDITEPAK